VNRDAIRSSLQAQPGSAHHIRYAEMPGVAQQGNFVDVHRESGFGCHFLQCLQVHHHLPGF